MGFLLFLAVGALGAIAWLLFRIDTKFQAIGDMIHDANRPEEQPRLAAEKRVSGARLVWPFRSRVIVGRRRPDRPVRLRRFRPPPAVPL